MAFERALRTGIEAFLFLVVLAMLPYTDDPTGDIKWFVCSLAGVSLAIAWIVGSWKYNRSFRRPQMLLEIVVLFLLLNLVAASRSSFLAHSLNDLRKIWSLFLVYLVASQVYRTPTQIRRTMLVVCVAVALSSLYGLIIQKFGYDPFPWSDRTSDEYLNLPGTFGNPNYAAHTLVLVILMAVYLALAPRRIWCLGFAALFLVHLRFTGQRGGLVALAAVVVMLVVARVVQKRASRPVNAVVASLFITGVLGLIGVAAIMGLSKARHGTPYPLDLSLLIRYKSYCSASRMILDRPLLGYGPANYRILYPPYWTPYEQKWFAQELKMNAHVHNDLLEVAVDAGLPAAGLYLTFLALGMSYGLLVAFTQTDTLRRRLGYTMAGVFLAFLVDGCFGFNFRVPVSASVLFVMAGAFEGFWSSECAGLPIRRLRLPLTFWQPALILVGSVCFLQDAGVFVSNILLQRGSAQLYWKRYETAEKFLAWGERLNHWNWNFPRQRALAALGQGNWTSAIEHFGRTLKRNPNHVMTLIPLAQAKMSVGIEATAKGNVREALRFFDEAAGHANRVLQLCPIFGTAEELLGRICSARAVALSKVPEKERNNTAVTNAWKQAETHFGLAIQEGIKQTAETYRQLAQIRIALNDSEGAEDALVRATQADPKDEATWPFFYGFAHSAGKYDRFLNALNWRIKRLTEQVPPDSDNAATACLWLASIQQDGYKNDDASEIAYRNAVHYGPLRPDTWSAYARFAEATKRWDGFKDFLTNTNSELLSSGKTSLPHVAAMGKVWTKGPEALLEASAVLVSIVQGRTPVAGKQPKELELQWVVAKLLEETAAAHRPADETATILFHLGMVSAGIDQLDLADRAFAAAMPNLAPDVQPVCAQYWADTLVRLNRPFEAVNLLRGLLTRIPENVDVRLSLARALVRAGQRDAAKGEYEAALALPSLTSDDRSRVERELKIVTELAAPSK